MDLKIAFGDREISTQVYIKMNAKEELLLLEGVCRQLKIVCYQPEVYNQQSDQEKRLQAGLDEFEAKIPMVRVTLVKSMKVPPLKTVLAKV